MATQPTSQQDQKPQHGVPYCSDPDCQYCKDLRAMQEAIRLHPPMHGNGKTGRTWSHSGKASVTPKIKEE